MVLRGLICLSIRYSSKSKTSRSWLPVQTTQNQPPPPPHLDTVADVFQKIFVGLWQFVIYLFIAWPRVYLGIKSSIKVLFAGIDQKINWGAASNACISAEETSKQGLPFKRFLAHYSDCMIIGAFLFAGLFALILLGKTYASVFLPFNLGMISISLLLAPFVAYFVSKQIRQ